MKLLTFVHEGRESWGAVVDAGVIDLGSIFPEIKDLMSYISSGRHISSRDIDGRAADFRLDDITFLPVIPRPEKIVCVARNYMEHHQEVVATGKKVELASVPPIFLRTWRSQTGHKQPLIKPAVSTKLDWEGELAVVIGKEGRAIPVDRAMEWVAGYSCYNEASVRDWQFQTPQITPGKNFDATGGFGPWMVTPDEISIENGLAIQTRLNDQLVQSSNTNNMIFNIAQIINYVSTIMTLVPGDVIATGTPEGIGWTRQPPLFMQPGDICEVEIQGIGTLSNPIEEK